jgi:hypothetical protein
MATTITDIGDDQPAGERAGSPAPAPPAVPRRRGPRRRPLAELLDLTTDTGIFAPHPAGHRLVVDRQLLARRLGITRQSLWGRINRLIADGLVTEHGRDLILHTDRIHQRVAPTVVALPTPATRRFHAAMAEVYTPAATADGTVSYLRDDGHPATLREMSAHMGWDSAGTAHHHLRRSPIDRAHDIDSAQAPHPACDDIIRAAAGALDSAAHLLAAAQRGGHEELAAAATRFADELMRLTATQLDRRDVNGDARTEPRHDVAFREDQRDVNAATSRFNISGSGLDGNSIHPVQNQDNARERRDTQRDPARDHSSNTEPDADADTPALWELGEWPHLLRPLEQAWYKKKRQRLAPINALTIARARRRPRDQVARAINQLADQVGSGVDIRDAAAVLGAAIRDDNPDYFPPHGVDDLDPAAEYLADSVRQIAADVTTQAGTDLELAAYLLVQRADMDDQLLARTLAETRGHVGDDHAPLVAHVLEHIGPDRAVALTRHLATETTT